MTRVVVGVVGVVVDGTKQGAHMMQEVWGSGCGCHCVGCIHLITSQQCHYSCAVPAALVPLLVLPLPPPLPPLLLLFPPHCRCRCAHCGMGRKGPNIP
jgi:hypothetical protein